MHVSPQGMRFVACREALVTAAYIDGKNSDGTPKYSIGFGSQSPPPKEGDTITVEEAFARLRSDIESRELTVNNALKAEITQPQFDALFSLYYQSGSRALRTIAGLFNEGRPIIALSAFMDFNRDRGVISDGLTKRRIREMMIGLDGYYGDLSQVAYWNGDPRKVPRQWMPFPDNI